MAENYSIKSRAHRCHVTDEPFVEDQAFVAAIFPDPESDGYLRQDFTEEAWAQRDKDEPKPFSFWRSHYKPPVKEEQVQVTTLDPESLVVKLVEEDEDHTENARFILAAMLERKKIIRETDTQQLPTGLLRIYEHRKAGDVYIIKDPQIALSDVESIQDEVQQLLDPERYAPEPIETPKETNEEAIDSPEVNSADETTESADIQPEAEVPEATPSDEEE